MLWQVAQYQLVELAGGQASAASMLPISLFTRLPWCFSRRSSQSDAQRVPPSWQGDALAARKHFEEAEARP